jgi:hypothetical protein
MGYDMHMVRKPASVPAGHKPQYEGQPEYHRFNIHWMPLVREMMQRAGVLDDYGEPDPGLPQFPPEGISFERADELMENDGKGASADEKKILDAYNRERDEILAQTSPDEGRVGYWKFCSNDGWLVTPDECRIIAETLSQNLAPELWDGLDLEEQHAREALAQWIGFARLAAENGGFRVW